jgi:thiol-disulfide isomerase/thioredoxin
VAPEPVRTYSANGVKVEAYDFRSFEKFLHFDDDYTYVVNFWATWCVPCVKELPNFEKLQAKYKDKNVKVILVSLDMSKQVESRLLPFIKAKALKSRVVYLNDPDANAWIAKVDPSWSGAIPATVIYKKEERAFFERSFTFDALETELKKFIN